MLTLLFIRHAESVGNQQGQMEGHGQSPLTSHGLWQARQLAQRLTRDFLPPTHIYVSPLRRAVETLDILLEGQTLAALVKCDDALKEFQNGIFQGLTWAEAMSRYPDLCHRLETSDNWMPIPQAETPAEGRDRAHRFIHRLLSQHGNGDTVWVISHSWILYHLVSELLGCDRTWQLPIDHTAIFEFRVDQARWQDPQNHRWVSTGWQIRRFNDCQHLNAATTQSAATPPDGPDKTDKTSAPADPAPD
ncbi:MAG: histidine phosphatase family protein [Synechococcales bacterium]|nr:histidine phosphatase family protein [Synechococcales bacterium]